MQAYVKNYRTALVVYVPRRAARIKITILQYFIVIKLRLQLQILARGAPFGGFSPAACGGPRPPPKSPFWPESAKTAPPLICGLLGYHLDKVLYL